MESLDGTSWDVVIAGSGIQQSLLALSLSRTNLRILHLDRNDYYGGAEAALSLQDAEAWVKRVNDDTNAYKTFSDASIEQPTNGQTSEDTAASSKLSFSRAYSLALAPQLVYSRSELLPKLVSSKVYRQLEFLAVGSWFTYGSQSPASDAEVRGDLKRIPSSREDVFADSSLDLNGRRRLMKFLRFIGDEEQQLDRDWEDPLSPLYLFSDFLEQKFGIPHVMQSPISALALSSRLPEETRTEDALRSIRRHLQSIGVFGRGFGSVIPKWGGLSEIAQVGCRAAAVGGATYVLDKPIVSSQRLSEGGTLLNLQGGESVNAKYLVGCDEDLPTGEASEPQALQGNQKWCHSISIVDSPLTSLFPPTSEGAPPPAGAVIYHLSGDESSDQRDALDSLPVYLHVHSSDTGECPKGQSIVYASIPIATDATSEPNFAHAQSRLNRAVLDVLDAADGTKAHVLWRLSYAKRHQPPAARSDLIGDNDDLLRFPRASMEVQFDDDIIKHVKQAWKRVVGDEADEATFMTFEDREEFGSAEDDDNQN